MPVTREQVLVQLDREEPNYAQAARLGAEALPHLMRLIEEGEPGLAAKATYLAGSLDTEQSVEIFHRAAQSSDVVVRVAAAASLKNLTVVPTDLAINLLDDRDIGVRKWTLKSLATEQVRLPIELKTKIRQIAKIETNPMLRQLANQISEQLE